jgi:dTDP-glucose 4,6-dehydratase
MSRPNRWIHQVSVPKQMAPVREFTRILVTGGAGFIGSNFVRWMLGRHPNLEITVLDKLTYAGNLANLSDVEGDSRFRFVRGDIVDARLVEELSADVQAIINFAAESHVDRSIETARAFVETDLVGAHVLLEAARRFAHNFYLQISTDEVYGDVAVGSSAEDSPLGPRSPYAATKAGADLLVLAYATTYGLPVAITRSSNNFGPYQYPEKIIPLFVTNALKGEPLPLYGDGLQVRDWLYVIDNCAAIDLVLTHGAAGEVYNVGGGNELTNLELTKAILQELGRSADLIRLVTDRPGHDRRYSVDSSKVRALGWRPEYEFATALRETVAWYRSNADWWEPIKTGEFLDYYRRQYADRLASGVAPE